MNIRVILAAVLLILFATSFSLGYSVLAVYVGLSLKGIDAARAFCFLFGLLLLVLLLDMFRAASSNSSDDQD